MILVYVVKLGFVTPKISFVTYKINGLVPETMI